MHLALAVLGGEALKRQKESFDGLALLHVIADEKDARHGFPGANAVVSVVGDCVAIMGEEDAPFPSRRGQDDWIGRCCEIDVVNADTLRATTTAMVSGRT
jgi:hypothetical protein